jgi:hypothetical protein
MSNHPRAKKFWKIALAETAIAVAAVAVWFYFRTAPLLAVPPPPVGDLYAYNWGFQWIVFLVFWLPATLLVVGIALAIQYPVFKSRYAMQQPKDSGSEG